MGHHAMVNQLARMLSGLVRVWESAGLLVLSSAFCQSYSDTCRMAASKPILQG